MASRSSFKMRTRSGVDRERRPTRAGSPNRPTPSRSAAPKCVEQSTHLWSLLEIAWLRTGGQRLGGEDARCPAVGLVGDPGGGDMGRGDAGLRDLELDRLRQSRRIRFDV